MLTGDDVYAIHNRTRDRRGRLTSSLVSFVVEMLSDASTAGAVKTDGVNLCELDADVSHAKETEKFRGTHLIQESDSTVLISQVTNLLDRADATAHRVDALEGDDLGRLLGPLLKLRLEVLQVVVLPNNLLRARVTDALDHRGMVGRVGEVYTTREFGPESGEGSIVGHIAGREDESGGLAVEGGQLLLEIEMPGTVTGDVPGTSSTVTVLIQSTTVAQQSDDEQMTEKADGGKRDGDVLHGLEDNGVVAHTQIVIRTPYLHLGLGVSGVGDREFGGETVDVVEVTVRVVVVLLLQLSSVEALVVETSGAGSGGGLGNGRSGRSRLCSSGRMERATGGFDGVRSGGRRRTGGLLSLRDIGELLGCSELLGHLRSGESLAGVGAHRDVVRVDDDALLLVELVHVDVTCDAGVAGDHLAGALGEGRAHDGTLCGLLGELSEGGEARRCAGRQRAKCAGLGTPEEGAGGFEPCERRQLVHGGRDEGVVKGKGRGTRSRWNCQRTRVFL